MTRHLLVAALVAAAAALAVPGAGRQSRPADASTATGVVAGVATFVTGFLLAGRAGAGVGAALGLAVAAVVRQAPSRASVRDARAVEAGAPLALDVLAACLESGMAADAALAVAARASPPPLAAVLAGAAHARRLGVGGASYDALRDPRAPVALRAAGAALTRAESSGAAPATELRLLASLARERRRQDGEAAARRAAVHALGPLACCFLPAFVLVGVVPLVAGLLRASAVP